MNPAPFFPRTAPWLAAVVTLSAVAHGLFAQSDPDQCKANLRHLGVATRMYLQDCDEVFPPTKSAASLEACLQPYVKNKDMFFCPVTSERYLANPSLNHVRQRAVGSAGQVPLLCDAKPHVEAGATSWMVAYADGHVARATAEPALGRSIPEPSRADEIRWQIKKLDEHRSSLRYVLGMLERGNVVPSGQRVSNSERARLLKAYGKQLKQANGKVRGLENELSRANRKP